MNDTRRRNPQARFIFTASDNSRSNTGSMKDDATINFVMNVAIVASQIALCPFRWDDSSAIWMPSASENASAIATVRIPPMTASLNPVPVFSPTIIPNVVMIPDVRPNDIPLFTDPLIYFYVEGV